MVFEALDGPLRHPCVLAVLQGNGTGLRLVVKEVAKSLWIASSDPFCLQIHQVVIVYPGFNALFHALVDLKPIMPPQKMHLAHSVGVVSRLL
jgi:hypothetical protein